MNPQDPNQPDTKTPDTLFGQPSNDDATPSISADFGTSSSTTPDADAAALQAIESLESESTTPLPAEPPVIAPVEPATLASSESEPQVAGVNDAKPFQSSYAAAPAAAPTPEPAPVTPVEASAAGLASAAGAQAGQALGASQSAPTPASVQASTGQPKKKSKLVLIIAIVLLAVAAGVAGYFVWQSTQTVIIPLETTTETGGDLPGGDGVQVNP